MFHDKCIEIFRLQGVDIIRMKCVKYDHVFANDIVKRYKDYPNMVAAANAEKQKQKRKPTKRKHIRSSKSESKSKSGETPSTRLSSKSTGTPGSSIPSSARPRRRTGAPVVAVVDDTDDDVDNNDGTNGADYESEDAFEGDLSESDGA
jgi:hypothetical protein